VAYKLPYSQSTLAVLREAARLVVQGEHGSEFAAPICGTILSTYLTGGQQPDNLASAVEQ
jgi:hypothetical protein